MNGDSMRRRRFLGVTATTLGVGLAGCSGGSADGDNGGSDTTTTESSGGGGSGDTDFGGWFDNVDNFDGVEDMTGNSEVTVKCGTQANGGGYGYGPAAIAVDSGTTVVWEWTGDGGSHNVAAEDGSYESELVAEQGHTFSHTFESAGTSKYKCVPHEALGMKGAVVVK